MMPERRDGLAEDPAPLRSITPISGGSDASPARYAISDAAIYAVDAQGLMTRWSDAMAGLNGIGEAEVLGRHYASVFHGGRTTTGPLRSRPRSRASMWSGGGSKGSTRRTSEWSACRRGGTTKWRAPSSSYGRSPRDAPSPRRPPGRRPDRGPGGRARDRSSRGQSRLRGRVLGDGVGADSGKGAVMLVGLLAGCASAPVTLLRLPGTAEYLSCSGSDNPAFRGGFVTDALAHERCIGDAKATSWCRGQTDSTRRRLFPDSGSPPAPDTVGGRPSPVDRLRAAARRSSLCAHVPLPSPPRLALAGLGRCARAPSSG